MTEVANFSYGEVARFEFGCFRKHNTRAKSYRNLMKIVAERMDVCSVVTNSGYMNLLSNILLEPYQMKLITQYKSRHIQQRDTTKNLSLN